MKYLHTFIIIFIIKVELSYYSDIIIYFDISKYLKIAKHILESVKLKKKNKDYKK